jgi:oxalate decarboxylase/phosphoglucose isomerase-like protein (cupin superfamily)
MHVHHEQDEWFYVLEGEFVVQVGDERFHLRAGDSLLAPRKMPHAFANVSETARLIVAFQPAGSIEKLFSEIAMLNGLRIPTLEDWQKASRGKGVDIVGPPLRF